MSTGNPIDMVYDMSIPRNPKRVYPDESIMQSLERIPFLKDFCTGLIFHSEIANKYMGYHLVDYQDLLSSKSINKLLEEAERRGDI